MTNYTDAIFDSTKTINMCGDELRSLARAFFITGNEKVSDQLINIADDLDSSTKTIINAVTEKSTTDSEQSKQLTNSLFQAVLHGCITPPAIIEKES